MTVDWREMQAELFPIKDYKTLLRRWQVAFSYDPIRQVYNFTLPAMIDYTQRLLGEDARQRYESYAQSLVATLQQLHHAGLPDILTLVTQLDSPQHFETFIQKNALPPREIIALLKYLVYWFIPTPKYLTGLVVKDSPFISTIQSLRDQGIRTNLDLLNRGHTPSARDTLAAATSLPPAEILDVVNLADFSRLPWTSKATIANIMGVGCRSIAQLAAADPQRLYDDFFRYGQSIGKNLKLGNEIESSHRIAKILPVLIQGN